MSKCYAIFCVLALQQTADPPPTRPLEISSTGTKGPHGHTKRWWSETIASERPVKKNDQLIWTQNPPPPDWISFKPHFADLTAKKARKTQLSLKNKKPVGLGVFLWAEEVAFHTALFIVLQHEAACRPDDPEAS